MKLKNNVVAFTGGGTAGHIYPGLAVADELINICNKNNREVEIYWFGCSKGMDKKIVESTLSVENKPVVKKFVGIPSGKLRRYFSFKNFTDFFRIFAGFFKSYFVLLKLKPCVLFSKGGFVSVPPCFAAHLLKIPVYTHECDFTLGLANRINFKSASKMFVSYEETKSNMPEISQKRVQVSGNPIRPVFYKTNPEKGLEFLGINKKNKPLLLVLGGSSGAKQINHLIFENLAEITKDFTVVHQTGLLNNEENTESELKALYKNDYLPYQFIYSQLPDVISACDIVISRAGANSIWECAALHKPMILVPLCGNGTRGDQVDNAKYFLEKGACEMLLGTEATGENLLKALSKMKSAEIRKGYEESLKKMTEGKAPSLLIAETIFRENFQE